MRVIAGSLGGRRLIAPSGRATRPTSDRVREALFSILGDIEGFTVLDLYAGTGALGIEALSRGARHATFVEQARSALRSLRQNLTALDLAERSRIVAAPVERVLSVPPWPSETFDLVLIDPPYAALSERQRGADLGQSLSRGVFATLRAGGRVVLEHAAGDVAPVISGLRIENTRMYGDSALSFYVR
jgi:16S rRNA (guanine966-N2)-methyltransferase